MSSSYVCRRCGRSYSVQEHLINRFCRDCGSWLFWEEDRRPRIPAKEVYPRPSESLRIRLESSESSEWMGRRVKHPRWGEGIIRAQRHGIFELLVEFRNGVRTWVRRSECSLVVPEPVLVKPSPRPAMLLPEDVYRARWIIEALRLGIVPSPAVREFTFGRENEVEQIRRWLEDEGDGYLLLVGEYGSGKTHLLEYTRALALDMGYAVATCELDPNECPLHRPKRVYHKLIANFRFNDGNDDFRQFLRLIAQKEGEPLKGNPYVSTVIHHLQRGVEFEDLWEWIEGGDVSSLLGHLKMYDYTTASNIYCNILSALGYGARKLLNLKGILIQLDEAETLEFPSFYWYQHLRGMNFARALALVASNEKELAHERVLDVYEPTHIKRGEKTGLVYCGWYPVKYIYDYPCGLKVMFSLTPVPGLLQDKLLVDGKPVVVEREQLTPVPGLLQDKLLLEFRRRLELQPFSDSAKERIFEGIHALYRVAYANFSIEKEEVKEVKDIVLERSEENIRSLVKASVEAFDLKRLYPTVPTAELLR